MEYKQEKRICQNCKKDFTIEPEDFNFYEKIKVPSPTWCPECRMIRRLAYREDRSLYKDKCENCNKEIISIYNENSPFKVYCISCWHGDSWDGIEYGREYDFSKPFLEQFYELQKVVPNQATGSKNSSDLGYCNGNIRCKNCMLTFDGYESINCYNCQTPGFVRDSMDSDFIINGDHIYETLDSNGVYNTKFVYFSDECMDSAFLLNCIGCSNCFGCVNLRNQKYCIFNKKYTKEEYEKEIKNWNLSSYGTLKKIEEKFWDFYYKIPRRFALITNSVNVTGDDLRNTKNCQFCFATRMGVENSKFIFMAGLLMKDSYDAILCGGNTELYYENTGGMHSQRCFFSRACYDSKDIEYSNKIYNCSNCFGCTNLKNKKYCILNKQYTKEEYEELIPKIKQHMMDMPHIDSCGKIYKYGEHFPSDLSLFSYNETWAHKYFPLSKEEALEKGFKWHEEKERNYRVTLKAEDLPDDIKDVEDSILNEVIECEHKGECNEQCTEAFRILPNELQFHRQINITLPHLCPNCRYIQRTKKKNPPKLWHRKCMCNGVESKDGVYKNTIKHTHDNSPCQNEFETAISDERKEIVYCEKCYQAEFV